MSRSTPGTSSWRAGRTLLVSIPIYAGRRVGYQTAKKRPPENQDDATIPDQGPKLVERPSFLPKHNIIMVTFDLPSSHEDASEKAFRVTPHPNKSSAADGSAFLRLNNKDDLLDDMDPRELMDPCITSVSSVREYKCHCCGIIENDFAWK